MPDFEETLNKMLAAAGIEPRSAYTTGNVAKVLNVSTNMVIIMCDEWEPRRENKRGLECYRAGTHRRIPHHALVDWLEHNLNYNVINSEV